MREKNGKLHKTTNKFGFFALLLLLSFVANGNREVAQKRRSKGIYMVGNSAVTNAYIRAPREQARGRMKSIAKAIALEKKVRC